MIESNKQSLVTILSLSSLALSLAHFDDDWFNTVCQYFVVSELEEQHFEYCYWFVMEDPKHKNLNIYKN